MRKILNRLKTWLLAGIAVIIPLVITIYVVVALFKFADSFLGKFINRYLEIYLGYPIPGLGIIIALLGIIFVGMLAQASRMKLVRWAENSFLRIPLVNKIYFPIKKIFDFLFYQRKPAFKKAVLVEYPRKGVYSFGFITNESSASIVPKGSNTKYFNVFIPSSPSPLTGFTILVPEEELIVLDMPAEEILKTIISGGMLNPEDFDSA